MPRPSRKALPRSSRTCDRESLKSLAKPEIRNRGAVLSDGGSVDQVRDRRKKTSNEEYGDQAKTKNLAKSRFRNRGVMLFG